MNSTHDRYWREAQYRLAYARRRFDVWRVTAAAIIAVQGLLIMALLFFIGSNMT